MEPFHMSDVIPLLGLPTPPAGKTAITSPAPAATTNPKAGT